MNFARLAGADGSAPSDALGIALGVGTGVDEVSDHLVVRDVFEEAAVEPRGNLFSTTGDEPCSAVVIAEEVIPKGHPVVGVVGVSGEERADEGVVFFGAFVIQKLFLFLWRGEDADEVEVRSSEEVLIVGRLWLWLPEFAEVFVNDAIDGVGASCEGLGQGGVSRFDGGFVSGSCEGETRFPGCTG